MDVMLYLCFFRIHFLRHILFLLLLFRDESVCARSNWKWESADLNERKIKSSQARTAGPSKRYLTKDKAIMNIN